MTTDDRFKAILQATPETLAAIDAAIQGRVEPPAQCLRLLGFTDAGRELGFSRVTVWRLVKDGRLNAIEVRPGRHRIPLTELRRFAGQAAV